MDSTEPDVEPTVPRVAHVPASGSSASDKVGDGALAASPTQKVEAYSEFYRSNTKALIVFMVVQGASPHDAAECAQEAMAEAWAQWSSIRTPRTWVRSVATRTWQRRILADNYRFSHSELSTDLVSPGSELAFEEALGADPVIALLSRLPWRQRQVMAWKFDGFKSTEIADILKMSEDSVRSSLRYARRALREALVEERETNE